MECFARILNRVVIFILCMVVVPLHSHDSQLKKLSVAILEVILFDTSDAMKKSSDEPEATLALGLLAYDALLKNNLVREALGTDDEITLLQQKLEQEIISFAAQHHLESKISKSFPAAIKKLSIPTRIPPRLGQNEIVAGNFANWGTTTIETGLIINNNNGGAAPAFQLASFINQPALIVTNTAGLPVLKMSTDPNQAALSIADANGNFAPANGSRMVINGPITSTSTSTITTLSVVGTAYLTGLDVFGTATINGLLYQLANTASPNNILYVKKGPIAAPNQFNTIHDALNAITANSANNRFEIRIAPGTYVEPTLTMKAYVALVGESQELCVIQTSTTSQNIIVGAANSSLKQITLKGATDLGYAAILYNVAGEMHVWNCIFDSSDVLVNQTAAASGSFLVLVDNEILPTSAFTTGFKTSPAVSGMPAGILAEGLLWGPVSANITDLINVTGPGSFFYGANFSIGSGIARVGSTFLNASNGALVRAASLSLSGFDTAISAPIGVAPGPNITVWSTSCSNNTLDLNIQNPFTIGSISGIFDNAKIMLNPATTGLALLTTAPVTGGVTLLGPIFTATTFANLTNISPLINFESAIGVITGGAINGMSTNFTVTIASGEGYLMVGNEPSDHLQYTTWPQQALVLTGSNTDNFIYINSAGIVQSALSQPNEDQAIILGKVRTGTTGILFVQATPHNSRHLATGISEVLEEVFGPLYADGSIVTQSGNLQLNASPGHYVFGSLQYAPLGGNALTWEAFLGSGTNKFIGNQNVIDYQNYDGGSGSLVPIPLGQLAKHELYIVNGPHETYALVYSQTVFSSLNAATFGVNPIPPSTWSENICPIASIIVTNTTVQSAAIQSILDQRPRAGFSAASVAGVTVHGNLLGLLADDHPQYLLVNGNRAMSGNLNMGTNNIFNAGTVTASGSINAGGAAITGATNINTTGSAATMIGNSSSTNTITGITTINTTGSATTSIGNNVGPSTTSINGATTINATAGIPLSVTGNASNPIIASTGNSTTTAPALRLINNPTSTLTDKILTIDAQGNVKQGTVAFGNVIYNGGQAGPLTIGTTDATTMSFITNNAQRIGIDSAGAVTIANPTSGTALTIAGGGETITSGGLTISAGGATITGLTQINTGVSGSITTIGNTAAPSTNNIYGTTNINNTASGQTTTIGATSNTTALLGTVNVNTGVSTGATNIGNASSTTTVTGPTNINTSGTATTNIGTANGATNIGGTNSTNTVQGTTNVIGDTFMSAATGVVLTVTGNNANPSTVLVGVGNNTISPALKLINNPAGASTDFFLTIDNTGVVKQTSSTIQSGFIINGGQPGPLTIGTTDATTMSFITNSAQRIGINSAGAVTIATPTAGTGLTIAGGGETITSGGLTISAGGASVTGTTNINTSGTAATMIGNCSATNDIEGTTTINTSCTTLTSIGNSNNATVITGSAININTAGTGTTFIGNMIGNTIFTGSVGIGSIFTGTLRFTPITQLDVAGTTPVPVATVGTGTNPYIVYVQGRYAYVVNYGSNSLQVFDVSNPSSPIQLGSVATGSAPTSVYVQGRYAYVVNYGSNSLQVFDVSNPSSPTAVGFAVTGSSPISTYVQGRYAYVTNFSSNSLQVFDVSNPSSPLQVGSVATGSAPASVYVQGSYAYVINNNSGGAGTIQIFDVSNPGSPIAVGVANASSGPRSVYVQGRYAYVTTANSSASILQIFDVSNPGSPIFVSSAPIGSSSAAVYVQGRYAYVCNSSSLLIFDVSNPSFPIQVGSAMVGSRSFSIYVQGRYAYVTNFNSTAFQIFDLGGAYIQQLEAGGIEVGTLQTRENLTVNNDIDIKGGATIGRTLNVSANVAINGNLTVTSTASGNPPTITASYGSIASPAYSFISTNTSVGMYSPGQNQLALVTSNTARLIIDATGSVSYFSNYKVHATKTSAQNVTTNAIVVFNSAASPGFDINNNFNTATGVYKAPVTGYYLVSFNISLVTSVGGTENRTVNIMKNGVALSGYAVTASSNYTAGSGGIMFINGTRLVQLNQNDTLSLQYVAGGVAADAIQTDGTTNIDIHFMSF